MHGSEAVKLVIEHQTVSKQFTEAICVLKLDPHSEVVEHFKNLTKNPETTTEFLQNVKHSDFPEYHYILGLSRVLEQGTLILKNHYKRCYL